MDKGLHQQALGVDKDVPLLAFDLLAAIEALLSLLIPCL